MTVPELSQLIIALGVLSNCALSWRNSRKIDSSNENVKKIEVATNHMKDALVAATAQASHAKGVAEGKAAERANPT